jgi:hypothetical protein
MGYASKFERDLFLDIVRGVVVSTRVRQNGVAESDDAPESYSVGAMTVFPENEVTIRWRNDLPLLVDRVGVVTPIVVLGPHLLTKNKESHSMRVLLDAANPERTKFSYRLLNNIVAPALGSVLIVIAWPVAIYMKAKELFTERNGGVGSPGNCITTFWKDINDDDWYLSCAKVASAIRYVAGDGFWKGPVN